MPAIFKGRRQFFSHIEGISLWYGTAARQLCNDSLLSMTQLQFIIKYLKTNYNSLTQTTKDISVTDTQMWRKEFEVAFLQFIIKFWHQFDSYNDIFSDK